MPSITERLDLLKETIQRKDFLKGEGLSNEVNIRMFCYESKEEMAVRAFTERLSSENLSCNVQIVDLYETFLSFCEDKRILDRIPKLEERRGTEFLEKQFEKSCDAAISIVENNLYGLDIDERAYQLSYFSIMMQGCKYNRRFLKANVSNHLSNVVETNELESLSYEGMLETEASKEMSNYLLHTFKDALELGSLIQVEQKDYDSYKQFIDEVHSTVEFSIY